MCGPAYRLTPPKQIDKRDIAARDTLKASVDTDPLVRANVARALDGLAQPHAVAVKAVLRELLGDSSRAVRVEAAWVARAYLDTNSLAAHDLLLSLRQNLDQPSGLYQTGLWHFDRNENAAALELQPTFTEASELLRALPPARSPRGIRR